MADQAFSRAPGAPLVHGNAVPHAQGRARELPGLAGGDRGRARSVHFESYIVHDDEVGQRVRRRADRRARARRRPRARALRLARRARQDRRAVLARACARRASRCACFNPPRLDEPARLAGRDHRKIAHGRRRASAFVTGLCIGDAGWAIPRAASSPGATPASRSAARRSADVERAFAREPGRPGRTRSPRRATAPAPASPRRRRGAARDRAPTPGDGRPVPARSAGRGHGAAARSG